nr:global transcription factor group B1 [Tanacetum cinerariifolium]
MGSDNNSEWRPVAAVEISCEPCVRRHVLKDCAMVSTRPTSNGRVSIDANHEFAEVEEQIKVDDVMEVNSKEGYSFVIFLPSDHMATIREVHEEDVQKALAAFNSMVVGTSSVRQRCEKRLHTFLRKELKVLRFSIKTMRFFNEYVVSCNEINIDLYFDKKLNVAEVEEQIKVEDVMEVDSKEDLNDSIELRY